MRLLNGIQNPLDNKPVYRDNITKENTNMQKYLKFSTLFNKYQLKAQFETLSKFGEALAHEGFAFEDSLFSRWKNSSRMPRNRTIVLAIIKVFIKHKGIQTLEETTEFLKSLDQTPLTSNEQAYLFNTIVYRPEIYGSLLTESDAFFLSKKILGLPFTTLHMNKIRQIYTNTKHNPHLFIKTLQQLEISPYAIEEISTTSAHKTSLIKENQASFEPIYIKKRNTVIFPDYYLHHHS